MCTIGTMIERVAICVCSVCGHRWLPTATEDNPKANPRKVLRCAKCKSKRWNQDDPKAKPSKRPVKPAQRAAQLATVARSEKTKADRKALTAKQTAKSPAKTEFCRHRIFAANCPICNHAA